MLSVNSCIYIIIIPIEIVQNFIKLSIVTVNWEPLDPKIPIFHMPVGLELF